MKDFNARVVGEEYVASLITCENQGEWMWYHCYHYFSTARLKPLTATDYNMLSLHLSVYLAAENMYHGSSFILQNSYKIHREGIKLICSPKYHKLSGIAIAELILPCNLALLFELVGQLELIYQEIRRETYNFYNKPEPKRTISQNLLTKILLGTLGCVPAFDKKSRYTFKQVGIAPQTLSKECLLSISKFYHLEIKAFQALEGSLAAGKMNVPEMKLVDIMLQTIEKDLI